MTRPAPGPRSARWSQVSDSTNSTSEAAPSTRHRGNQSHNDGAVGDARRISALTRRAAMMSGRGTNRTASPGRNGAISKTSTACIAAFALIKVSLKPRSSRSSAISHAVRLYVRPKIDATDITTARERCRWLADAGPPVSLVRRKVSAGHPFAAPSTVGHTMWPPRGSRKRPIPVVAARVAGFGRFVVVGTKSVRAPRALG